jgi:two-component system, sensor histidine kinase
MRSTPPELARSALDAAPDAMLIIDASGAICYANRQVTALFQYDHNDLVGQSIERLMPERFRVRHVHHRDRFFENMRLRPMGQGLELFARRADGSEFPVEISLSPIDGADRMLVAAAIRNVTERKHAEAELIAARQSAERAREAADQARASADEARQIADRANQGKSRFLATASHDLRQPLQTLALLNGTLRRLVDEPDAAQALEQQEMAIDSMSRLLNALLDISKLESGTIKPEPTDFAITALFETLRGEFTGVASRKGLELLTESAGESVHSDPSLVEQILRNLVSNAIKYTRTGSVTLQCRVEASALIRITVVDTGVGIPSNQLPLICEEFYQVGVPANSSRDGYGLGLSIVQRLVKLLKLGFDIQSEVGKGSRFSVVLPPAQQPAATPVSPKKGVVRETALGKARVLLVEDDPAVRDATRMLLKVEGYQVVAVTTLQEAVQAVRDGAGIDLLVTDYHLSNGETGTQVIRALREALSAPLKAVLITGDTSSAVRNLPVDTHLKMCSKPVKADELLTLLRALLAA